jgi:hypothetical protein
MAIAIADGLRPEFPGILPLSDGSQQESHARTSRGFKKLDVNYSTVELGLGLGVSLKSIGFKDKSTKRYTKNYSRNDAELRAEATDYHQRQPYTVLVAVLMLPRDSCHDALLGKTQDNGISSFGACVRYFRRRANRQTPRDDFDLFERFFIGIHEFEGPERGWCRFVDVMVPPPRAAEPSETASLSFQEMLRSIKQTYDLRNNPPFEWAP